MDLFKKDFWLFLIPVFCVVVSLELEMRVFQSEFPLISTLLFMFTCLVILQILLFLILRRIIVYRFNNLNKLFQEQEKINRNLMFALEEIMDLHKVRQ